MNIMIGKWDKKTTFSALKNVEFFSAAGDSSPLRSLSWFFIFDFICLVKINPDGFILSIKEIKNILPALICFKAKAFLHLNQKLPFKSGQNIIFMFYKPCFLSSWMKTSLLFHLLSANKHQNKLFTFKKRKFS